MELTKKHILHKALCFIVLIDDIIGVVQPYSYDAQFRTLEESLNSCIV